MKARLGISECLLGRNVRYDGGHRLDRFLVDMLGQYVQYVPVCPEKECGFGVPREAMRLLGDPNAPCLVTINTNINHTDRMRKWVAWQVRELESKGLCGFVFKSRSPSCGMEGVTVYDRDGASSSQGVGLFAKAFMEHFPLLPVEEDERLHDPLFREDFFARIFCHHPLRALSRLPLI
ncbi:MAG: DUF523 domain-containing protein [Pseudomonadota bacterium]